MQLWGDFLNTKVMFTKFTLNTAPYEYTSRYFPLWEVKHVLQNEACDKVITCRASLESLAGLTAGAPLGVAAPAVHVAAPLGVVPVLTALDALLQLLTPLTTGASGHLVIAVRVPDGPAVFRVGVAIFTTWNTVQGDVE